MLIGAPNEYYQINVDDITVNTRDKSNEDGDVLDLNLQ